MNWLVQRPIAHRGLHKGRTIPENSYSSFQRAIDKNYAIELDIRMTKDKKLIVFHDESLLRVCDYKAEISNFTYEELNDKYLYETSEKIPLLKDVLYLVGGRVPLLLEIKSHEKIGRLETILSKELDKYKGEFAICSFNTKIMNWFRKYKPNYLRGIIYGDLKRYESSFSELLFVYRLIKLRPNFVSLQYELLDTMIPKLCRLYGKKFVCWTVDSKDKMNKAKSIADNVIFENISI